MPRRIPGSKRRYVDVQLQDAEYSAIQAVAARRKMSMAACLRSLLERPLKSLLIRHQRGTKSH